MKTNLILVLLSLMIKFSVQVTSIHFSLDPQEKECLYEYFSDKTLVIYEAHFNVTDGYASIIDPDDKVMIEKQRIMVFKEAFTTFSGGYYGICLTNKDRENISNVNLVIKHGVAAKDYSSVAKTKDLKPMELDVYL